MFRSRWAREVRSWSAPAPPRSPALNPFAHRLLADAKVSRHFHNLLAGSDAAGHQKSTVGVVRASL